MIGRDEFERYVAIGDSQTEGLNDPDGRGGFRGWADRFADVLGGANPRLQYANLAVRGKLIGAIHREQLAPALAMRPDIATVMAGLNDLIRVSVDLDAVASHLDAIVAALRDAGTTVVTNTFPDPSTIAPLFRRLAPRIAAYNERIRDVAATRGALLVDFAAHDTGTDPQIWSPDRIHANPLGHSLIAAGFADTLGFPGYERWIDPLPALAPLSVIRRVGRELTWLQRDVAPWMMRRLRGQSSGDGFTAKRPALTPVAPLFHVVAPAAWPKAGRYRPRSLAEEGFVHLSFADQVERVANARYLDEPDLAVVEIEPALLDVEVRVEDSYGAGETFPHAYGPLAVIAAVAVHPLVRAADGSWRFSRDGADVPASQGR